MIDFWKKEEREGGRGRGRERGSRWYILIKSYVEEGCFILVVENSNYFLVLNLVYFRVIWCMGVYRCDLFYILFL